MTPQQVRHPAAGPERGSGTVMAIGLVGMVASLLVAGLLVAAVAIGGQRARTAADLAALAVVGGSVSGMSTAAACTRGADVAGRHEAALTSCVVELDSAGLPRAVVEVALDVTGTPWTVTARSAAGGVVATG